MEADEFCQKYKFHLNESLDEVPTHDNQTVWRWLNIPDEGFDFLKKFVGKIIVVPCFLSTSDYKNSGYSTFFEIKTCTNSNGRYVAKIADKLSEGEILFKSNTYFKIDSFDKDTIYMTEVKASDYDLILYENFWDNLIPQSVYEKLNE
nr:ADP-ribosyltransferase [Haliscomenobacter sp.]